MFGDARLTPSRTRRAARPYPGRLCVLLVLDGLRKVSPGRDEPPARPGRGVESELNVRRREADPVPAAQGRASLPGEAVQLPGKGRCQVNFGTRKESATWERVSPSVPLAFLSCSRASVKRGLEFSNYPRASVCFGVPHALHRSAATTLARSTGFHPLVSEVRKVLWERGKDFGIWFCDAVTGSEMGSQPFSKNGDS